MDRKKSKYRFQIPKDSLTKIEKLVKEEYPNSFERNLVRHLFVVDYISRGSYYFRGDVPVNRQYLMDLFHTKGSDTQRIIKNLCTLGVIEKTSDFEVGVTANRFRIKDKSKRVYSIPYDVFKYTCTKSIIDKHNTSKRVNMNFQETEEAQLLLDYIAKISIDRDLLEQVIDYPVFPFIFYTPHVGEFEESDILELKAEYANLLRIYHGDLYVKRTVEGSRVYTPFTNMHREHRKYLSYEGKGLKCVDIANSQPTLAAAYMQTYCDDRRIPYPRGLQYYKKICEDGLFYEEFMVGDERLPENRGKFKKDFFGMVFYTKPSSWMPPLRKRFVNKFPEIYKLLDVIKEDLGNDGFATEMQRLEAGIIFDNVNVSLLKDGMGCYNIYDSIVSHDDAVLEEAKMRIKDAFRAYGITPTLKVEDFKNY